MQIFLGKSIFPKKKIPRKRPVGRGGLRLLDERLSSNQGLGRRVLKFSVSFDLS